MQFQDRWLRFGCFLTGFRYGIVKTCSEAAAKKVKRYASAMVIITIVWAFVGYTFSDRYLKTEWFFSLLAALITVTIIVQIERIVILSPKANWMTSVRMLIGLTMALIGSVIVDQIIFKEDIEKEKLFADQEKIERLFVSESAELRRQISQIDTSLHIKEIERQPLAEEVFRHPMIPRVITDTETRLAPGDSVPTKVVITKRTEEPNPKIEILKSVDDQMDKMLAQKREKETQLLNLRPVVEAKVKKNTGFLDELEVLLALISKSAVARVVWLLWIVLFLGLEMLVLIGKMGEKDTDYDVRLAQQMQLHITRLNLLAKQ